MKEILGNHLMNFMIRMSDHKEYERHQRTYKGDRYEVWEVSEDLFKDMCDMTEEMFVDLDGEDAWWRSSDGSNMGSPYVEYIINGQKIYAWDNNRRDDYEYECKNCSDRICGICNGTKEDFDACFAPREYRTLSEYLCEELGASQPRNVCALAMELARYNNMKMGELFSLLEN